MFQSTHPRGARPLPHLATCSALVFQSTPRGGRDMLALNWARLYLMFQSTRPRGARHGIKYFLITEQFVSIHAPTRGATLLRMYFALYHAAFQSTRPRGARHSHMANVPHVWIVSIHAPTAARRTPCAGCPIGGGSRLFDMQSVIISRSTLCLAESFPQQF